MFGLETKAQEWHRDLTTLCAFFLSSAVFRRCGLAILKRSLHIALAVLLIFSYSTTAQQQTQDVPSAKTIIAHRGASAYAPENTLPAFRLAFEMGADFIEYDVQVTKDKQLVILHDQTLERTTNVEEIFPARSRIAAGDKSEKKHWYVYDFTLAEIKKLDAGSWAGAKFRGTSVPTFRETLDFARGRAGHLIELKVPDEYNARGVDMERLTLAELKRYYRATPKSQKGSPIIIQSFSARSLQKIAAELKSPLPLHLLTTADDKPGWLTREGLAKVKSFCVGISPHRESVIRNPDIITWAHELGLQVTPYTFTTIKSQEPQLLRAEMLRFLYTLKADGVITDNPDLAVEARTKSVSVFIAPSPSSR
ncbi:MAG: hypothetical protein LC778_09285 [Acidobacteria bacterium]|nr:hypothetical protein [Acidobacteriota bacterium]